MEQLLDEAEYCHDIIRRFILLWALTLNTGTLPANN